MRPIRRHLDHAYVRRRLPAYLDNDLGARGRERVERHARECEDCGSTLRGLTRIGAALRRLGGVR